MPPDDAEGDPYGPDFEWVDAEAGPVVRPYAVTGGRSGTDRNAEFDLIALIQTTRETSRETSDDESLRPAGFTPGPEHEGIIDLCHAPLTVAEVASEVDLPVGVVRILLGDLLDHGLIHVRRPTRQAHFPDVGVLKEVINGLSAL